MRIVFATVLIMKMKQSWQEIVQTRNGVFEGSTNIVKFYPIAGRIGQ